MLPQLRTWLPPSVQLDVLSDRTTTIRASVDEVQLTLRHHYGAGGDGHVSFSAHVSGRHSSQHHGAACARGHVWRDVACGYSLDNLSLMAITVSVGFVVDDAIVVIENIVRFIEQGDPPLQAAFKGARQIGFTVISMSLSLVAVFYSAPVHGRIDWPALP